VLKIDPRMLTLSEDEALTKDDHAAIVALINPSAEADVDGLWLTPDAFSIAREPDVGPAARLCAGAPLDKARDVAAAVAVDESGGMGLYLEVVAGVAPASEIAQVITALGGVDALAVEPMAMALGGDTTLAGSAVRLDAAPSQIRLLRQPRPGSRRIFSDTPIVPMKEWHPLQARRIRYFKKKKDEDS
jgi:hypothetical protein